MQSDRDSLGAPPSYDEIFGGTPGASSPNRSRLSPRNLSSRSVSPRNSAPSADFGVFQNFGSVNNFAEDVGSRTPSSRHDTIATARGQAVEDNHVRVGSLRESRLDPTAPLRDQMEELRIAGENAVSPPYPPSLKSDHRSAPSSSQTTNTRFAEPSATIPNWEQREEELEMRSWFAAVDEDNDGYITTTELQQSLLNDNWTTFSMETIQMVLKIFDKNCNNVVDFDEFIEVKKYINQFKSIFDLYDKDRSGTIDVAEIRAAFLGMGHRLSENFCKKLCRRFCQRNAGKMNLDAFIYVCATVNTLHKNYQGRSSRNRNETFEEVLWKWID